MKPVFRILFESVGSSRLVSTSSVLFETTHRSKIERVRRAIEFVTKRVLSTGRKSRGIVVVGIDWARLRRFNPDRESKGYWNTLGRRRYASVKVFAAAIGANPATVRVALSKARVRPEWSCSHKFAELRGVTFRYAPSK